MINYFNFKPMGGQFLLTNDLGSYFFLSTDQFRELVTVCHSVYRPETAMFRSVVGSGYFERLTNSPKWSILPA